jgi:hypothetical protein
LRGRDSQQGCLHLSVKIRGVIEDIFGVAGDNLVEQRHIAALLLPLAEVAFFHRQASPF